MTLRITAVSDLHLDISSQNPKLPGGDVLILAGDTCEAHEIKKYAVDPLGLLDDTNIKLPLKNRINRFLIEECAEKYEHVIYIIGNHEGYTGIFDNTEKYLKDNLPDNFHVLEKNCFEIGDVLFLGGTMWTDMNNGDPLTKHAVANGMNDFHIIQKIQCDGSTYRFTVEDAIKEYEKTIEYFKLMLELPQNKSKKVVITTHHSPTHMSIGKQYIGEYLMNGGYSNRLGDFILDHENIKYWFHGHHHTVSDYMVGQCRVICNPRGYHGQGYNEYTGWDQNRFITL